MSLRQVVIVLFVCTGVMCAGGLVSADVLLQDDFEDGDLDGWTTPYGEWDVVDDSDPEHGKVMRGRYIHVEGVPPEGLPYAYAGDLGWTDYVLDLDIKGIVGIDKLVLFRLSGDSAGDPADGYYNLNMRSGFNDAFLSLESCGGFSTGFPVGNEWYHVTVEVIGDRYRVWAHLGSEDPNPDKDLLFDTECDTFPSGLIGVSPFTNISTGGQYGNTETYFDNVVVTSLVPESTCGGAQGIKCDPDYCTNRFNPVGEGGCSILAEGTCDHVGFSGWDIPLSVFRGSVVDASASWCIADCGANETCPEGCGLNENAVTYVTVFGDWQPDEPLATLVNGELMGAPRSITQEFSFTAPTTPGIYRMRWNLVEAFAPVDSFCSHPDEGPDDPGCGRYAETSFVVCSCPADANGDGAVDPLDSGFVLARFGTCQ